MVQVMRALAALAVLVQHGFHEAQRFNPSPTLRFLEALPWHIGVDVFFVISGFIMMHTAAATFGKPGAARAFMLRRLIRIVPPYWFFTSLMVIATLLLADRMNTARFEPMHALLSYLFMPHLRPGFDDQIHPILALGWTLLYEMFFYVAFALALLLNQTKGLTALFVGFLLLFLGAKAGLFTAGLNVFWSDRLMFASADVISWTSEPTPSGTSIHTWVMRPITKTIGIPCDTEVCTGPFTYLQDRAAMAGLYLMDAPSASPAQQEMDRQSQGSWVASNASSSTNAYMDADTNALRVDVASPHLTAAGELDGPFVWGPGKLDAVRRWAEGERENRLREDVPRPALLVSEVMRLAPESTPPFIKVPKVLGEGEGGGA